MTVIAIVLIVAGTFFLAVSAFGLIRFPDFYTRAHVVAKSESLGVAMIVLGVIVHHRGGEATLKLLFLVAFALVANPTAIHALARAHRLQRVPVEPDPDGEAARRGETGWIETIGPDDGRDPTDPAALAQLDGDEIEQLAELSDSEGEDDAR